MTVPGDFGDSIQERKAARRVAPTDNITMASHAGVDEMKLTVLRVRLRPRGFSARALSAGIEDGPPVDGPASGM